MSDSPIFWCVPILPISDLRIGLTLILLLVNTVCSVTDCDVHVADHGVHITDRDVHVTGCDVHATDHDVHVTDRDSG